MKTICKYIIKNDTTLLEIPSNLILSAVGLKDDIAVYAVVDTERSVTNRYEFKVYKTGNDIDIDLSKYMFLDTVKLNGDIMVFHVFFRKVTE